MLRAWERFQSLGGTAIDPDAGSSVRDLLEPARRALGRIHFDGAPDGARFTVRQRSDLVEVECGARADHCWLRAGAHDVTVQGGTCLETTIPFQVEGGRDQTIRLHCDLRPVLELTVPASTSVVRLDGIVIPGHGTARELGVEPGDHTLEVWNGGTLVHRENLRAAPNGRYEMSAAPSARLTVSFSPADAEVLVDGEETQATGWNREFRLRPGSYRFEVRSSGYSSRMFTVELRNGDARQQRVDLVRTPRTRSAIPFVSIGVGAAGAIAGGVLAVLHVDALANFRSACGDRGQPLLCDDTPANRDLYAGASQFATASLVTTILGGALVATGIIWALIQAGEP